MLEHQKIVLSGVSDHPGLFRKELRKSLAWLNQEEKGLLRTWLQENYYHRYADIINEVFHGEYQRAS